MMNASHTPSSFTRRGFLGIAGAAAVLPLLAACTPGGSGGGAGSPIKFWDMPWGQANYNVAAKKLAESYAPKSGLPSASYQTIQWNNFYQTFSSAIASKTGPAVSTGGGFQAFQFSDQGAIAYADDLIDTMKKSGQLDDFLPGTIESMKTDKGYVAVPWQLDMRVIWYRKSLLEKAGVDVPTDWNSFKEASKALAKIGVFGFGIGAGAGNNLGNHAMVAMMIGNGGGMFNTDGKPDLVTDRNIEAMEFIRELVSLGAVDPAAVSYTSDNLTTQWKSNKIGMGWNTAGLPASIGDTGDVLVTSPLAGPHGDKATLAFGNNIMMYKNTPSQQGSEEFLAWYLKNMKSLWDQNVVPALPVLKSIAESETFKKNTQADKIIQEWQPVSKTFGEKSSSLFGALAAVDGGQAITQFTQTMLQGKTDAKTALQTFQTAIEAVVK
jgi:multiple sugar transport system substrate-binding protein